MRNLQRQGLESPVAYGVLENLYQSEMTNEQAKQIAEKAVSAAMERDPGSGNGIDALVIPNVIQLPQQEHVN